MPTFSIAVQETLPTAKFDRLGNRPSNGLGSGVHTTTALFLSQMYFWLPNEHILRMRLNVLPAFSSGADIQGLSVYGTENGFSGRVHATASLFVDAAWEYSATRNWVLALDATYRFASNTRVTGYNMLDEIPSTIQVNSGPSDALGFAPAVEYNWKRNWGVLLGVRIIAAGHDTAFTISPAVAVNFVH
jgi:hypothetical protein